MVLPTFIKAATITIMADADLETDRGDALSYLLVCRTAVDFTHSAVNDDAASIRLAEAFGVRLRRMAAVGNSYSDLPLLRLCGLRVAMANAPPEPSAIDRFVLPGLTPRAGSAEPRT